MKVLHQNEGERKKVGRLMMQKCDGQIYCNKQPYYYCYYYYRTERWKVHLQVFKLCVLIKQKMIPQALYNQVLVSSKIIIQRTLLLVN